MHAFRFIDVAICARVSIVEHRQPMWASSASKNKDPGNCLYVALRLALQAYRQKFPSTYWNEYDHRVFAIVDREIARSYQEAKRQGSKPDKT